MLTDIFITTKNRPDLLRKSLTSLLDNTNREEFRLTIVQDGDYAVTTQVLSEFPESIDHKLIHRDNMGLGPSINQALSHIDSLNKYYSDKTVPAESQVSSFICYCQDDLIYTPGWLNKLEMGFLAFERAHKLGFATGLECVEHPVKSAFKAGNQQYLLKDWIRAAQMFARSSYWMSMHPITRYDPETRTIRAKPNDGIGSGVDWWFIRDHENSVCRTGRTCLVMPGLVKHIGYNQSTWLKRDLPESDSDKSAIAEALK